MADDDFAPTSTTGYKVGEKKTVEELAKLDENDGKFITMLISFIL